MTMVEIGSVNHQIALGVYRLVGPQLITNELLSRLLFACMTVGFNKYAGPGSMDDKTDSLQNLGSVQSFVHWGKWVSIKS